MAFGKAPRSTVEHHARRTAGTSFPYIAILFTAAPVAEAVTVAEVAQPAAEPVAEAPKAAPRASAEARPTAKRAARPVKPALPEAEVLLRILCRQVSVLLTLPYPRPFLGASVPMLTTVFTPGTPRGQRSIFWATRSTFDAEPLPVPTTS